MARFVMRPQGPMRQLLLMRHAAAAAKGGDRDRPLTADGRRAAATLGRRLKTEAINPDHVLCSPAQRARETLDGIAEALDGLPPADFDDGLYLADSLTLLGHLRSVPAETQSLLLVGHNPGLEELVRALAGPANAAVEAGLPAAGLAIFRVTGDWSGLSPATARLAQFITR
jgi:phosphohistidine phosphatase